MKAEWMVVCDYAVSDAASKMTLVGTFDRINVPQVPFNTPQMGIGIKLRFEDSDKPATDHPVEVRIKNPVGGMLGKVDANLHLAGVGPGEPMEMGTAQLALMIGSPAFTHFGKYTVELWVDKRLAATVPIFVVKTHGGIP